MAREYLGYLKDPWTTVPLMHVRLAERGDVDRLLELMRGLARFEEHIDRFAVTRESVLEHGFGDARLFTAFVAEQDDDLVGMAVVYTIPWTYTLRPKVVLKELFVEEAARNMGAGRALMAAVISHAKSIGAADLIWTVMAGNSAAEGFYRSLSASPDHKWNSWALSLDD